MLQRLVIWSLSLIKRRLGQTGFQFKSLPQPYACCQINQIDVDTDTSLSLHGQEYQAVLTQMPAAFQFDFGDASTILTGQREVTVHLPVLHLPVPPCHTARTRLTTLAGQVETPYTPLCTSNLPPGVTDRCLWGSVRQIDAEEVHAVPNQKQKHLILNRTRRSRTLVVWFFFLRKG